MSLAPATRIGPYQIVSMLGSGGMGEVYRARDTRLERTVALKMLPAEKLQNEARRQRFLHEARAASALNHPHIVTIYDIVHENEADFLVMEFVAGKSLDEILHGKRLRLNEALRYAIQIADALAAAHRAGIVHRDLKPGNIMITDTGAVKLLDFGLAKLLERSDSESAEVDTATRTVIEGAPKTAEGTVIGTPAYMSPEQAEGKTLDARTDIFSFGCVLYEMITGQRAFRGDSHASTLSAILRDEPKAAGSLVREVPRDLEKIIARCLRKDAERRFQHIADVKVALEEVKEESESGAAPVTTAPARQRRWWIPAAAAAIAVAGFAGWFVFSRRAAPEIPLTAVPFTSYEGFESTPSFSPDGRQIAFQWTGATQPQTPFVETYNIYIKMIGPGEPLRLTNEAGYGANPAWSPDGQWIAFTRSLGRDRRAIILIPPLGGSERKIAENAGGGTLAWAPDAKWILFSDRVGAGDEEGLFLLSVATGEKRNLTRPVLPVVAHRDAAFSQDGRFLAYTAITGHQGSNIYVLPLTADFRAQGEPRAVTTDGRNNDYPAWTADGKEIVYSSNRGGGMALWRTDLSNVGHPQRLAGPGEEGTQPAIARGRLAYTYSFSDANIWRIGLSPGNRSAPPEMFFGSTRDDLNAAYSPDGTRIVFQSTRSGAPDLWICSSDGSHPQQLTSFAEGHTGSPQWSPDGSQIAFDSNFSGRFQLYVVSAGGGAPRRLTDSPAEDAIPRWSRDGRWIYFRSNRGGSQQIWKIPSGGGNAVQVTNSGGNAVMESIDGRWLYFTKMEGDGPLWKLPTSGGAPEAQVVENVYGRNFAVMAERIYFVAREKTGKSLHVLDLASGRRETVAQLPNTVYFLGISVSPDEKWAMFSKRDRAGSDLMLVENFR